MPVIPQLSRIEKRDALEPRRDPYYESLGEGRSLGYRVMTSGNRTGNWIARVFHEGRYFQKALGDFAALEPKARYRAARADAETWFDHIGNGGIAKVSTVADACHAYLAKIRGEASPAAPSDAASDAEGRFTRLVFGGERRRGVDGCAVFKPDPIANIDLVKLTKTHMSAWRERILATHTPATFNRNATALRAALNWARECGKVATDQAWLVALREIKGTGKRRDLYLDATQRKRLIECADAEVAPFLAVLNMLPLRPGEAANLTVADFNARTGELCVRGKTGSRTILLGGANREFFKQSCASKLPGAWIVGRADGAQWKKWDWKRFVNRAVVAAGLPRATVAYSLRHALITDLIVGGLDIFHVAKIAGTSVAMIEKHYGHLQQGRSRDALDRLASL